MIDILEVVNRCIFISPRLQTGEGSMTNTISCYSPKHELFPEVKGCSDGRFVRQRLKIDKCVNSDISLNLAQVINLAHDGVTVILLTVQKRRKLRKREMLLEI